MDRYEKAFKVFKAHYVTLPLETFKGHPYKSLVAIMMSARTNDDTTAVAATRLFTKAPTVQKLAQLPEEEIAKLIYPVGFYKTKAKHLKGLAQKIIDDFNGEIPSTIEALVTLPGVGRKTANVVINRVFDVPAIAVDTHVHRISNMMGWVHTKEPAKTEMELVRIVPKKYWRYLSRYMVSIGRQFRSHKKLEAFLAENGLIES